MRARYIHTHGKNKMNKYYKSYYLFAKTYRDVLIRNMAMRCQDKR